MRLNRAQLKALFTKNEKGEVIFIGDSELIVNINKRYETFAALSIEQEVTTMGYFEIVYKGERYGYNLPAMITMHPSLIEEEAVGTETEVKLTFVKGDVFIKACISVKRSDLVFAIFKMFVFFGIRYRFMTANNISRTFDHLHLTGFKTSYLYSSIVGAMYSELYRASDQIQLLHRLTDQTKPGVWFGMKNVTLTARTLMTKLAGSYLRDNINSALVNPSTQESQLEQLLRK